MANVTLIEYTGKGRPDEKVHAANLLMFTKQTRLNMTADALAVCQAMPDDERDAQLAYMAKTIRSSWEFVNLTFLVEGVTRAVAQQMTRTRTASFAMQSMRVTDVRDIGVLTPASLDEDQVDEWQCLVGEIRSAYSSFAAGGVPLEDARGILPLNTHCNLVVNYNLRSFADVLSARRSLRAQGEYGQIVLQMEAQVIEAWPWVAPFFVDEHSTAITMLEGVAKELGGSVGTGPAWEIAKAIDLLRKAK